MMGFFAVYAGLIYNGCFSLGSICSELALRLTVSLMVRSKEGDVAEILPSLVPTNQSTLSVLIWHVSSNGSSFQLFQDEVECDFCIIQMFAGTCLKGANAVYSTRNLTFLRIRSWLFSPRRCLSTWLS
jgi:V-type H+-transporting ATPase subunit a